MTSVNMLAAGYSVGIDFHLEAASCCPPDEEPDGVVKHLAEAVFKLAELVDRFSKMFTTPSGTLSGQQLHTSKLPT